MYFARTDEAFVRMEGCDKDGMEWNGLVKRAGIKGKNNVGELQRDG